MDCEEFSVHPVEDLTQSYLWTRYIQSCRQYYCETCMVISVIYQSQTKTNGYVKPIYWLIPTSSVNLLLPLNQVWFYWDLDVAGKTVILIASENNAWAKNITNAPCGD